MRCMKSMLIWCGILAAWPLDVCAKTAYIDSVALCSAPTIRNDSLIYTLDIHFRAAPKHFWSYHDDQYEAVVVEFLDVQIEAPYVELPAASPLKSFKVKNMETKMALTGVKSDVVIGLDPGAQKDQRWDGDVIMVNANTVRVTIWKKMTLYQDILKKEKRRSLLLYGGVFLSTVLVVLAAIGAFMFFNTEAH